MYIYIYIYIFTMDIHIKFTHAHTQTCFPIVAASLRFNVMSFTKPAWLISLNDGKRKRTTHG